MIRFIFLKIPLKRKKKYVYLLILQKETQEGKNFKTRKMVTSWELRVRTGRRVVGWG